MIVFRLKVTLFVTGTDWFQGFICSSRVLNYPDDKKSFS